MDRTSFRHVTYRQADKAVWDQISDHSPVLVELCGSGNEVVAGEDEKGC